MYNLILITFRRTNEMAVIDELLRSESNGNISFGNHELAAKAKLEDYEHAGDMYKVKTFQGQASFWLSCGHITPVSACSGACVPARISVWQRRGRNPNSMPGW